LINVSKAGYIGLPFFYSNFKRVQFRDLPCPLGKQASLFKEKDKKLVFNIRPVMKIPGKLIFLVFS
jgi:hypothetical protein